MSNYKLYMRIKCHTYCWIRTTCSSKDIMITLAVKPKMWGRPHNINNELLQPKCNRSFYNLPRGIKQYRTAISQEERANDQKVVSSAPGKHIRAAMKLCFPSNPTPSHPQVEAFYALESSILLLLHRCEKKGTIVLRHGLEVFVMMVQKNRYCTA